MFSIKFLTFFLGINKSRETERKLYTGEPNGNLKSKYANNSITTSKYNWITFLPYNLFEQFHRLAICYTTLILIIQLIPLVTPIPQYASIATLLLIVIVTGVKDAVDDIRRHRSDNLVNSRTTQVLRDGTFQSVRWDKVIVGDILRVENNEFLPADALVLSSSEPHALCCIETADLDGETNLKSRQALPDTAKLIEDSSNFMSFQAELTYEAPNNNLNRFDGRIVLNGKTYSLSNNQILLRGCTLRNTDWCYGLVLFAGKDTKLMQNGGKAHRKSTRVDSLLNQFVMGVVVLLLSLCTMCVVLRGFWEQWTGEYFQAFQPRDYSIDATDDEEATESVVITCVLAFFSHIILYSFLVPVQTYICVEVVRSVNSLFIDCDLNMVHQDVHAQARNTGLTDSLGQIQYIFSDKTGTLTQNIMTFNKCSINGRRYGDVTDRSESQPDAQELWTRSVTKSHLSDDSKMYFPDNSLLINIEKGDPDCDSFFRLLCLCHTVMPDERTGSLVYQAQSPDERALVEAARTFGFVFLRRTPNSITCKILGQEVEYELLDILDFNNIRKRMSIIIRKDGKITLFCKGADFIIMDRLASTSDNDKLKAVTNDHLSSFASEGLRTLCLARRDIPTDVYTAWKERYHAATIDLHDREEKMDAVAEEIEKELVLIGATGVEDKLQDGVADTIYSLSHAGIKIWVLTGDKQETAINIGYSSKLLTDDMRELFVVDADTIEGVQTQLTNARAIMLAFGLANEKPTNSGQNVETGQARAGKCALVVQGISLEFALASPLDKLFLEVASLCKSVICCRVTPLQKALIVSLVKKHTNAVTLAIGDGANDVSMIKVADVGVGISGQEGMQAVLASDYSLAQFRFLKRLLLVHGRWSHLRMAKFLRGFFYKTYALVFLNVFYAFFCGYTAQTVLEVYFNLFYNLLFTMPPVVVCAGFLDRDVSDKSSLAYPGLYEAGRRNFLINRTKLFASLIHGVVTAAVMFFIAYAAFSYTVDDLHGRAAFGMALGTILVVVVSVQVALNTTNWTLNGLFTVVGCLVFFFCFTFFVTSDLFVAEFYGADIIVFSTPAFWLTLLLIMTVLVVPVVAARAFMATTRPTLSDRVRLLEQSEKTKRSAQNISVLSRSAATSGPRARRSSYAFSHEAGFGGIVTAALDGPVQIELQAVRS